MRSQKGQSTVELALCLTVLVFLLFGIIDFGRILFSYLVLDYVSREGARSASVGHSDSTVLQDAEQAAIGLDVSNLTVTVSPDASLRTTGSFVTVAATYKIDYITPILATFFPNPYVMESQTVMRVE